MHAALPLRSSARPRVSEKTDGGTTAFAKKTRLNRVDSSQCGFGRMIQR